MKIKELIECCGGIVLNNEADCEKEFHKIVTDSRKVESGDIFVALKGQLYDGHQYIEEALKKGAAAIFTEEEVIMESNVPIVKVKDTYQCLFDLATYYLNKFSVPVIAITGSVGKTTTKELIAQILSKKYQVLKSEGNKNNRIGIPQTIFELNSKVECLVVELGMNHLHEIDKLSNLVHPNLSVITNIGSAHIGNLGSKKNILKAKLEITDGMDGGLLLVNGHDRRLKKLKCQKNCQIEKVYTEKGKIQIELLEQSVLGSLLLISDGIEASEVFFKNPGLEIVDDIALALRVGELFEVPFSFMIEALMEYHPPKQRFMIEQLENGHILINDCYNSSYESLKMALDLLKNQKEHKILILGDILELGKDSKKIHQKIGKQLRKISNTDIYFIGEEMKEAWKTCKRGMHFRSNEEWILYWSLKKTDVKKSIILLKGSRKMKLEELISYLI